VDDYRVDDYRLGVERPRHRARGRGRARWATALQGGVGVLFGLMIVDSAAEGVYPGWATAVGLAQIAAAVVIAVLAARSRTPGDWSPIAAAVALAPRTPLEAAYGDPSPFLPFLAGVVLLLVIAATAQGVALWRRRRPPELVVPPGC
jgi:hypothetical protein